MAVLVLQLRSGVHQQRIGQQVAFIAGQPLECHIVGAGLVLHVLPHQEGAAGQVGAGHGGAAGAAIGVVVQGGVDIAAHSGDVRLQPQSRRSSPGGENAHPVAIAADALERTFLDGQGTHAVHRGIRQGLPGGLRHRDRGDIVGVDGHIERAGDIVVDDDRRRLCVVGVAYLLIEGDGAAGDHSDLALHIQAFVILGCTVTGDHDILVVALLQLAEGMDALHACGGVVHVGVSLSVQHKAHARLKGVIDAGHSGAAHRGAGGGQRAGVRVVGKSQIQSPVVPIGHAVAVASRNRQEDARFLHAGIDIVIGGDRLAHVGEARRGAQAHVDDIHTQPDRVLHAGQNVGVAAGALIAHDLEHSDLGLGRNTAETVLLAVIAGADTGNMGAVVGAPVVVDTGGLVEIVEGKGHLGADIARSGGVHIHAEVLHIRLGQPGILRRNAEGVVVGINAAVQDGDHHALALVAQIVSHLGNLLHLGGGTHQGVHSKGGGHIDTGDPVQLTDGLHVAKGHIHGDGVGSQGVPVLYVCLLAVKHLFFDALDHGVLLAVNGVQDALTFCGDIQASACFTHTPTLFPAANCAVTVRSGP